MKTTAEILLYFLNKTVRDPRISPIRYGDRLTKIIKLLYKDKKILRSHKMQIMQLLHFT